MRRAVSFYHKDSVRGFAEPVLLVPSLALTWILEGHDCYDHEPEKGAKEWEFLCDCECCCINAGDTWTGRVLSMGPNSQLHGGSAEALL